MKSRPTAFGEAPKFPFHQRPCSRPPRGFALIVTISLMVLLALLAVGLLGLSTISLRGSSQGAALAEARSNAKLALMLAVGELQQELGPDRRVTAPSGIFDENPESAESTGVNHRRLTGVWQARDESLDEQPDYDRGSSFRRWLVSNADREEAEDHDFARSGTLPDPVRVALESESPPEGAEPEAIRAGRVPVGEKGAYAWWVADENVKGFVNPRDEADRADDASITDHLASFATPGAHGLRALAGFEEFPTNTPETDRLFSFESLELLDSEAGADELSAHLSPHPRSVLASVTSGSLRKDLSLYLEREDIDWLQPWGKSGSSRGPGGPLGPNDQIALSGPREYDVLAWKYLHHWYHMHRQQLGNQQDLPLTAMKNYTSSVDPVSNPAWNSGVTRVTPVLVRLQLVLSYGVEKTGRSDYNLFMYSYPVVTLWNPYSVPLEVDQWSTFLHTLPLEHTIYQNGSQHVVTGGGARDGKYNWGWPHGNMTTRVGGSTGPSLSFAPGEAKVLTYTKSQSGGFNAHDMTDRMQPWLPSHAGQPRNLGSIQGRPGDRISIETATATWDTSSTSYAGRDFQTTFDFRCEARAVHSGHPARFQDQMFSAQVGWRHEPRNPGTDFISKDNFPSRSLSELENSPTPFIHLDIRLKTLDEPRLPNKTWLHNIPSHPFAAATSTSKHSRQGVGQATTFFSHPYTLSFEQVNNIEGLIQNRPFFGSSNRPGGQGRIAAVGVPLAPLTSLAQIQNLPLLPIEGLNWSGHYFQNQAVANSFASPGLPPSEIRTRSFPFYLGQYFPWQGGDITGKTYHGLSWYNNDDYTIDAAPAWIVDRSYVANQLLFDDYFFSSMAAQEGQAFRTYGSERGVREIVSGFFNRSEPLPIARYRPYQPRGTTPEDSVEALVPGRQGTAPDAHLKAAAHLMVDGGFNINSTSVPAWTVLLASSHLKRPVTMEGRRLREQDRGRFIVSRHSPALAGAADNSPGAERDRWLGYRELTAEEIQQLAEAIVRQVKQRGPFRSLGEFVNRRRSDDVDLAVYGALQAALEDPQVEINRNYRGAENEISSADIADADYPFPEAALGSRYQGTPAYISQADLLTPIAPILQARSDTFVIRAYGEARTSDGGEVLARAWCEAVVQRYPDYLDPADAPEIPEDDLTSEANRNFGRRFGIESFRWLPSVPGV
jgi:hypothetical protein